MVGLQDGRMEGWSDGRIVGLQDGRMVGWQDDRMVGWQDVRMVGRQEMRQNPTLISAGWFSFVLSSCSRYPLHHTVGQIYYSPGTILSPDPLSTVNKFNYGENIKKSFKMTKKIVQEVIFIFDKKLKFFHFIYFITYSIFNHQFNEVVTFLNNVKWGGVIIEQ